MQVTLRNRNFNAALFEFAVNGRVSSLMNRPSTMEKTGIPGQNSKSGLLSLKNEF
jgi:hypothetical protein